MGGAWEQQAVCSGGAIVVRLGVCKTKAAFGTSFVTVALCVFGEMCVLTVCGCLGLFL